MTGQRDAADKQSEYMRDGLAETRKAADAAVESAGTADESLVAVQRPFVHVQGFHQSMRWDDLPDGTPTNIEYRVTPILENSGATPTVDMRLVVEYEVRTTPLPAGFDFSYSESMAPVVIGPHGHLSAATGVIPASDLVAVKNGSRHVYVWGTAGYADVFDPAGLVHEVRFCYRITNVLGDPANPRTAKNPAGTDVEYTLFMHSEHNSAR